MSDFDKRLARLEEYVANRDKGSCEIVLRDGSHKMVPISDVILMVQTDEIAEIRGEDDGKNGKLLSLLRGVIEAE